jgi:SAM-dependent methyltransferase
MNDWDKRYEAGEHVNDEPHPLVAGFVSKLTPGRALDIASGTGRHSLLLAERAWQVTAVDYSRAGMRILEKRCREKGLRVNAVIADLERHEFEIERDSYDLIVVCNYLQRDLFPRIISGTRPGGTVIAVIAMADDDPNIKPMNPAYLLKSGELASYFEGWEFLYYFEGKPGGDPRRRRMAEVVVRRLSPLERHCCPKYVAIIEKNRKKS